MNKHIDPNLSPETLQTYQGYSLQVFSSGRIKLSFHRSHKDRREGYNYILVFYTIIKPPDHFSNKKAGVF